MAKAGVPGAPAANQGVVGNQAPEGAPAPTEPQVPVTAPTPPGSGASGFLAPKTGPLMVQGSEPGRVPLSRFKEIYDERNQLKAELEQVRKEQQGSAAYSGGMQDVDLNAEIQKWQSRAIESDNDTDRVTALSHMMELRGQQAASSAIAGAARALESQQIQQQFAQENAAYANQARQQFPELNDPNSDFFKQVDAEWSRDVNLQLIPSGEYDAACRVWSRTGSGAVAPPPALESGGRVPQAPSTQKEFEGEYKEVLDSSDDRGIPSEKLADFLTKHQLWTDSPSEGK